MPATATWAILDAALPTAAATTPLFPSAAGADPCDAVFHEQAHYLEVINRIFPFDYVTPLRNSRNGGYELLQGAAQIGERLSLATFRLECGALAMFAPVGARATGEVELLRPDASHGAVTVKAGTRVTTSRGGRAFDTTEDVEFGALDLGPLLVPVRAVAAGYEWNVPGRVTTSRGEVLAGDIDTMEKLITEPPYGDPTIEVSQAAPTTGGVSPMLEGLGADRGVTRKTGESVEAFRFRVRSLPDTVSPAAIVRVVTGLLGDYGIAFDFIETFEQSYQTCYDAPSPNAGTPTFRATMPPTPYDPDLFVYDDPRPQYPLANVYLDIVEYRGTFIIVLERATLLDFGMAYDDPGMVPADFRHPITERQRGTSAYDVPPTADPALAFPAYYDGYDVKMAAAAAGLWETLREIKAAGTAVVIEQRRL